MDYSPNLGFNDTAELVRKKRGCQLDFLFEISLDFAACFLF